MNLHQPTPESDPRLDALLDEALAAGDVSSDLQGRILALTDPGMTALLDEALAPETMPAGLEQRVSQQVRAALADQQSPVLATLGPSPRAWLGYAAAAAVVLATGLVFYTLADRANPSSPQPIVQNNGGPETFDDTASLLAFASDAEIEAQISSIQSRILRVSDDPIWGAEDDFQSELWRELAPDEESAALLF